MGKVRIANSYECTMQFRTPLVEVDPEEFRDFDPPYEGDSDNAEEFIQYIQDLLDNGVYEELDDDHKHYELFSTLYGEDGFDDCWDDSSNNGRSEEIIDFTHPRWD